MAHGSRYHRRPGSMGPVAPNRVFKGKNLAGRMGGDRVTIQNLEVVQVVPEKNVILIKGNVPVSYTHLSWLQAFQREFKKSVFLYHHKEKKWSKLAKLWVWT